MNPDSAGYGALQWKNARPMGVSPILLFALIGVVVLAIRQIGGMGWALGGFFLACVLPFTLKPLYKRMVAIYERGVLVRLAGSTRFVPWSQVSEISYQEGSSGADFALDIASAALSGVAGATTKMGIYKVKVGNTEYKLDEGHLGKGQLTRCVALIRDGISRARAEASAR